MKVSYNWLTSLIPALTLTPAELAELLTKHSYNTEIAAEFKIDPKVTVVKIIKIEPHPNADRLRLATITDGQNEVRVVCGAPNIKEGDVVPYSPPGTTVRDENGEPFQIKLAKIRGVESPGMLNSPRELGLGEEHGGIYILPSDTPLGSRLAEHLPNDTILEAEVTPDRAHDSLCHLGIAREVGMLLNLEVVEPPLQPLPDKKLSGWQLDIAVSEVDRYLGVKLKGAKIQPSPLWMQARIWALGHHPINNVVDISNYVTWEFGNPTHTFDAAKLNSRKIGARFAKTGETLRTLDDVPHELTPQMLVITNNDEPVAAAGVIGGEGTEVDENTTEVFLESASFHAYTVQRAATLLKTATESSARFGKGLSPVLAERTATRALNLLNELAGAEIEGVVEYYPRPAQTVTVKFNPKRVSRMAGVAISDDQVVAILKQARCDVRDAGDLWQITPPIERLDLAAEHDLVEEVIRIYGLENIPATTVQQSQPSILDSGAQCRENIRDLLIQNGLTETYNYSWEDENLLQLLNISFAESERLALTNPTAPENKFLRRELMPRLLGNVLTNKAEFRKKFSGVERGLFEIGTTFQPGKGGRVPGVIEEEKIAMATVGANAVGQLTNIIDALCRAYGISKAAELAKAEQLNTATSLAGKIGLPVATAEFSLSRLIESATQQPQFELSEADTREARQYVAPSKYPPVYRDLAILVDPKVSIEQVRGVIARAGGKLVADVDLFDVYDRMPDAETSGDPAKKSLAFHIAYQAPDRTLTSFNADALHQRIVKELQTEFQALLR